MSTITANLRNVAGIPDNSHIPFWNARIREGVGGAIITPPVHWAIPVNGVITVELEPGPCKVSIGNQDFDIVVTEDDSDLFSLIDEGLPQADADPRYVVNGGGVGRLKWVTQAQWAVIAPGSPNTTYLLPAV